ncbi:MAG: diaminopimelate epimerase [Rickettsiales bacterium]
MTKTPFLKMHGTGNDFVILDGRTQGVSLSKEQAVRLCDRHFGIGCDTLVILRPSKTVDVAVEFMNADGSMSATCGNASRCVAELVMGETGRSDARLETKAGVLETHRAADGGITVNMGAPKWGWADIPLSESRNTMHLGLAEGLLMDPVAINMGNPHAIFFVHDLHHIKLAEWGPKLEHNALFPARVNVSAVQVMGDNRLKMMVWERGVGLTMACGSGACAAVVAATLRGLTHRQVDVELPGGTLAIDWQPGDAGDVLMSGPVARVFEGEIEI